MKLRILVLGCKGMAGHMLKNYLDNNLNYEVWGIARGVNPEKNLINLDVTNTKKLEKILNKEAFDVVINSIGLLNNTAEDNAELAVWFNSYFPQLLASYGEKYNFKLIHISTDCVFSGKEGAYKEDSFKDGTGFYAQSKALGEVVNSKDLTLRTSIIGPELKVDGIGLFHWFMSQSGKINGFTKTIWSGVTTLVLAHVVEWAIENKITGLYHVTNNGSIDKYTLLSLIKKYTKKSISIIPVEGKKTNKSFIDTRNELDFIIPSYNQMVKDMIVNAKKNKKTYSHYDF